jgi:hypothetical protein
MRIVFIMTKSKCTIDIKQNSSYLEISIKSPKIQKRIKEISKLHTSYSNMGYFYDILPEIRDKFITHKQELFINYGDNLQMPNLLPLFFKNFNTSNLIIHLDDLEQKDIKRYCALVETAIHGLNKVINSNLFNEEWLNKALEYYDNKGVISIDPIVEYQLKAKQEVYLYAIKNLNGVKKYD